MNLFEDLLDNLAASNINAFSAKLRTERKMVSITTSHDMRSDRPAIVNSCYAILFGIIPYLWMIALIASWRALLGISIISVRTSRNFFRRVNRIDLRVRFGRRNRRLIQSAPGQKLLRIAEIVFSPKTVMLTFRPLVADWQFEYFEALNENRSRWHLRMITFRYYWYFAKACGLTNVVRLFKGLAKP